MRSMPRSLASACLGLVLPLLGGCAFEAGVPWAEVAIEVDVAMDLASDRLDDEGRLLTDEGYAVTLERVEVLVARAAVRWTVEAGAADPVSFDPTDPPAGYTNCHSGHCHTTDSGDIVDFATIEASLGTADVAVDAIAVFSQDVTIVSPGETVAAAFDPCGDACLLDSPGGAIVGMDVLVETVRVEGRVFDVSDEDRLGTSEGVRFAGTWEVDTSLSGALTGETFGDDTPGGLAVTGRVAVPSSLLDGIAFHTALVVPAPAGDAVQPLGASAPVETAVAASMSAAATLNISLERFHLE